jgi:hypothetical protein
VRRNWANAFSFEQRKARPVKGQFLPAEGSLQTGNELASEYAAEHFDRQEEVGS